MRSTSHLGTGHLFVAHGCRLDGLGIGLGLLNRSLQCHRQPFEQISDDRFPKNAVDPSLDLAIGHWKRGFVRDLDQMPAVL